MKKNVFATFVLLSMVLVILFHFTGCEKLNVSNLRGNYYLKQANRYYQDEVYRRAIEAYENAIKEYEKISKDNPNLKLINIYLGTSYSQVYRPMKQDKRNEDDFRNAALYLGKAMAHIQENDYKRGEQIWAQILRKYDLTLTDEDLEQRIGEIYSTDPESFLKELGSGDTAPDKDTFLKALGSNDLVLDKDAMSRLFPEVENLEMIRIKKPKIEGYEPKREEVIVALGDLYDKGGIFEKAEEYYQMILEKKKREFDTLKEEAKDSQETTEESQKMISEKMEGVIKAYYTLANFYEKNGKTELAEGMYKQRIELDPKDPEGYHYFVGFLQNQRRWEEAITNHEKRLYAMLNPDIIDILHEIDQLQVDTEEVKKANEFIETVKKNRRVSAEEKQRLIVEAEGRIEGKLPVDEAEKKLEELKQDLEKKVKRAEAIADTLDEDEKQKVAETYYSIGNVCWNWSYQTPADFMSPELRKPIIEKGLASLDKATKLTPDYADPYAYMGLLWREMIKVDPLKREQFIKKNEEYNKKFTDIYKRKKRQEEYKKQLEEMGQE